MNIVGRCALQRKGADFFQPNADCCCRPPCSQMKRSQLCTGSKGLKSAVDSPRAMCRGPAARRTAGDGRPPRTHGPPQRARGLRASRPNRLRSFAGPSHCASSRCGRRAPRLSPRLRPACPPPVPPVAASPPRACPPGCGQRAPQLPANGSPDRPKTPRIWPVSAAQWYCPAVAEPSYPGYDLGRNSL